MITKQKLEELQKRNIDNANFNELVDISKIPVDAEKSQVQRVTDFIMAVKNPYLFKVGDMPVKISFSCDCNKTFQQIFTTIIDKEISKNPLVKL